jgi:hypothetical protein
MTSQKKDIIEDTLKVPPPDIVNAKKNAIKESSITIQAHLAAQ